MTMKIGFTGKADHERDLDLEERVVFVVDGFVKRVGTEATATQGHRDVASITLGTVVELTGPEKNQWRERLDAAQRLADEEAAKLKTPLSNDETGVDLGDPAQFTDDGDPLDEDPALVE